MSDDIEERVRALRHDLAGPLSAILAETQLLLMQSDDYDSETVASLKQIEELSRRMRSMIQDA